MERESFEDPEVADLLNRYYVAVKVDREERPDIDHIYMTVCQALTGSGGWPLTVITTPDGAPLFAGTYFPKRRRFGRPGLMDILEAIARRWAEDAEAMVASARKLTEVLRPYYTAIAPGEPTLEQLKQAVAAFRDTFDPVYGGFGQAPKFPVPHNLMFLLRWGTSRGDKDAVDMVLRTLEGMYRGGVYDHVGFGFARYSTDDRWLVPHFEKMLYDNALLTLVYLEAYQCTGEAWLAQVARDVMTYVEAELTGPEGACYSAQDADAEGVEGKYYVWTPDEVMQVLGPEDGTLYCRCYGITPEGNFEGRSIPNLVAHTLDAFACANGLDPDAWKKRVREWNERLRAARSLRVPPATDDKVLTGWNSLMAAAYARAAKVLQEPRRADAARRILSFIETHLTRPDGRLLARYRDGEAAHLAVADDYAYLVWAWLEMYDATLDPACLRQALTWQQRMDALFWDEADGGYFLCGSDAEALLARPKVDEDGALPSGNAVTAWNLVRIARLTGDSAWADLAERELRTFSRRISEYPMGAGMWLVAAWHAMQPPLEIVLSGARSHPEAREAVHALQTAWLPHAAVLFRDADPTVAAALAQMAPFTASQVPLTDGVTVYRCSGFACQSPTTNWRAALADLIGPAAPQADPQ
ncbi:MAG: thioredoxin domain-containing protein [Thermoflavifilum sp.]|nr:thioredoxin domain-containing protein [Thermoflavifilum sp.]MCL6512772.1 thioredoxin domain-containing protein [Alicyclobacillus sp.]